MINEGLKQILSAVAKMLLCKIAEIEKEEVESPVFHLVARSLTYCGSILFLFEFVTYIFQLYKEDCTIL